MKKTFQLMAVVALAALTFTACKSNNNQPAEEATPAEQVEQVMEDQIDVVSDAIDTVVNTVAEETKTAAKKVAKTTAKKVEEAKQEMTVKEETSTSTTPTPSVNANQRAQRGKRQTL